VIEMKMHPMGYLFLVGGMTIPFVALSLIAVSGQGLPMTAVAAFAAPCFIFTVCWVAFAAEASIARAALSRFWAIRGALTSSC
jgi:hypothetical protein